MSRTKAIPRKRKNTHEPAMNLVIVVSWFSLVAWASYAPDDYPLFFPLAICILIAATITMLLVNKHEYGRYV